tara:strand:- start:862 stop:1644 length:783 start_codon:yes stop_codon:yes gene_type:complete
MTSAVGQMALQLRGVSRVYQQASSPELEVLRDVDLDVRSAEFVALIGPSGCGKSTLLGLIAGLDAPTRGEIDVGHMDDLNAGVAYMPQRDLLLPWRSLVDNVILGAELRGENRHAARRRALRLLPEFGLEGFGDALPRTLSGGMRQRAALLRTIMLDRPTLLLDEPFGALDALTRAAMQEWLLGIWRRRSAAVLLVTHDVEEAVWLSDRVYVMTSRPGSVKLEVNVGLPRPRGHEVRRDPRFVEAKHRILDALLAEDVQS